MNVSSGAAVPKLRIALVAALAMLAAALTCSIAPAAASTGGVSADGGTGERTAESSDKYVRLWDDVSSKNKRWARKTSACESGGNPKAIGGGGTYRGAFQFMKSTWRNAPKSPGGDPVDYPYRTQAVVAVALKHRDGAGQWPNCG